MATMVVNQLGFVLTVTKRNHWVHLDLEIWEKEQFEINLGVKIADNPCMSSSLAVEVGGLVFSFYNTRQAPTKIPLEQRAHFYTGGKPCMFALRGRQPGRLMFGLFCVTPFRTRGCTPCGFAYPCVLVIWKRFWQTIPKRQVWKSNTLHRPFTDYR